MMRDIAALRRSIDRLAVRQEHMAGDIASLQAAEKEIRYKLSALPPKPTASPATKPLPKPPSQAAPKILAAPPTPALPCHHQCNPRLRFHQHRRRQRCHRRHGRRCRCLTRSSQRIARSD
jgi:hypothetical protein